MKTILGVVVVVVVLALVGVANGQVVNPSTATWTAPTTNTDNSPLTDLLGYNILVAGPLAPAAPCPAYTLATYPVKATHPSPTTTPLPNTTMTFGTPGSRALSANLGLTVDGTYCIAVRAVDVTMNESAVSNTFPFVRHVLSPSAPSGLQVNQ